MERERERERETATPSEAPRLDRGNTGGRWGGSRDDHPTPTTHGRRSELSGRLPPQGLGSGSGSGR